ncbi:ESX secretion-associated protein EspG [Amycolatopsis acidiphila]|uniref:ESX secretion-associated protein EspG n=1 Tax=Amycolatopsis acidiphila TaxID=715473 RepID=A0A557ZY91_9PSEU|nr:ESX secretion-associated protein EspG [Amycolatopsis acidiphila]TVT16976.1 ESX secretion-associated protein EspG [Amycolatopsis acidiphila]UIJ62144.1 ESX secretion-associated protein EspG [Amycolatopsis acidiphila]GHG92094.1 ESX secretion-associated protein EspG [Amycolatopsis acidiphila]
MIQVSASAFDILWHDLGLPPAPVPLDVHSVGGTERERAEIREAVYQNLAERGLCAGGRVDQALVARLETLAGAEVYVECEALPSLDDDVPLRAVAAAGGKRAVLAAQPSRTIGLSTIRDTELCSAVVGLLPPFEPGPGFGVSVPASALSGEASAAVAKQLAEIRAIQARPVLGAGQFSIRVRDGARVRRAGGLSWFTTDAGAYCGTVAPGRGGEEWLTLTPADPARVTARLADLLG